nr:endogenous retrovirus group K member 24 Gag polyprotein isoform X2 [Aotus nancymaae]
MGQQLSAQQKQYITVLKQLLKASGSLVLQAQLRDLMQSIVSHNPWFPGEGTLHTELWEQVGRNLKQYHAQGPWVPVTSLTLWALVRAALAPLYTEEPKEGREEEPPTLPCPASPSALQFLSKNTKEETKVLPEPPSPINWKKDKGDATAMGPHLRQAALEGERLACRVMQDQQGPLWIPA